MIPDESSAALASGPHPRRGETRIRRWEAKADAAWAESSPTIASCSSHGSQVDAASPRCFDLVDEGVPTTAGPEGVCRLRELLTREVAGRAGRQGRRAAAGPTASGT